MLDDNDEKTTFEQNPLGNRQRLVPRASFLARRQPAGVEVVDEATAAVRGSMIMDVLTHDEALESGEYTLDEALLSGQHTISEMVLPASSAVMLPAIALATPGPSISPAAYAAPPMPQAAAVMLLPSEIHYPPVATPYYPPTDTHTALPIASRRVRYIAVPAIAMLALVVLGGAMIPPKVEPMSGPAANVSATQEATSEVRIYEAANEPPAPAEEVDEIKPVARPIARSATATPVAKSIKRSKSRKITVNTSSALGNLRPRKAW